ncbi:MAG TPA: sugar phosphate isomerase/epimerase [Candidatus Hydrogenedentes bacterium]|nr:sugar phosphate isomerase/epimerase [Candidatus Hydrogenedentota bacterium]HPG70150.1 sugar phosphate isomerase/epimerase [Candidatus Hydrogenedentota bacterium]
MQSHDTTLSRRSFIGGAAALAASAALPRHALAAAGKPNSNFNGVQIGTITYSYRSMPSTAEDLLGYLVQCGLSSVELMGGPAEEFARKHTPETGIGGPMDGFEALRKMYNDAGVNIYIVKFGDIGERDVSDDQIDYYFKAAKALGAKGITREISEVAARRLGPIADKHEIVIGFHNHTQINPKSYDGTILSYGKYLGINLDIGHYVAGTNEPAIPMIEKHRDRILSLHLKDRKKDDGPNMPFGHGDTQVAEVLRFVKENKLTFPGDIELEYPIPEGSDAVQEVAKCVQFCKESLA